MSVTAVNNVVKGNNIAPSKVLYSKNIQLARSKIDQSKFYSIEEACTLLKEISFVKFDSTVELAIRLGVNPTRSDQRVRGVALMPAGTGKAVKVAVICSDDKVEELKSAGADIVGSIDIIDQIKSGNISYDVYVATPAMMGAISRVAKILGPKGLMPNPKLGTVTNDVAAAVQRIKSGQVEFKTDKTGNIHAGVGKISFDVDQLVNNVKALVTAVVASKPEGVKGTYLKAIYLSTTMSPSLRLNVASLTAKE